MSTCRGRTWRLSHMTYRDTVRPIRRTGGIDRADRPSAGTAIGRLVQVNCRGQLPLDAGRNAISARLYWLQRCDQEVVVGNGLLRAGRRKPMNIQRGPPLLASAQQAR